MNYSRVNCILLLLFTIVSAVDCFSAQPDALCRLLQKWPYEVEQAIAANKERIIVVRDSLVCGEYYWKTDEYLKSPSKDKLQRADFTQIYKLYNHTERIILEKFLKKSPFRLCSKEETSKLTALLDRGKSQKKYCDGSIWELDKAIYLAIFSQGGCFCEIDYIFFIVTNNSAVVADKYSGPPSKKELQATARRIREIFQKRKPSVK